MVNSDLYGTAIGLGTNHLVSATLKVNMCPQLHTIGSSIA